MKRFRLLGVGLLAIFALFALVASSAFAEEKTKMLPESGVTFTVKSGVGKLTNSANNNFIECKKSTGTGEITSANLGKYTTDFEECKANLSGLTGPCTGAGESSGVILNAGTFHFWLAKETLSGVVKLIGVLAALPTEVHMECEVLGIKELILVKGCLAALAEPLNTLVKVTKDVAATVSKGVNLITKVLSSETAETECILLSEEGTSGFVQSAIEGTAENENFKKGTEAITVLLMNPEAVI